MANTFVEADAVAVFGKMCTVYLTDPSEFKPQDLPNYTSNPKYGSINVNLYIFQLFF